jgi:uncharacterized protein (TIGR02757 family)
MDFSSKSFNSKELKIFLDKKVTEFNTPKFLSEDPLGIVRRFSDTKDIEIMGLLMATIAWGNRKSILTSGHRLIEIFEGAPFDFVSSHQPKDFEKIKFVHRTFQKSDLQFFCEVLKDIYTHHSSLEEVFSVHPEFQGVKGRIVSFRVTMLTYPHEKRSEKHLANPLKNSAAKRLNMFLRWMVRDDNKGVDLGIWKRISPAELFLPLDVHTSTVGRKLGLISRDKDDWKALEELMENLRKFDKLDPCKYDFALFGLGAIEKIK